MQSISKTVTSVIIGVAMQGGNLKAGRDTPILKNFDPCKVRKADDRKRRMNLRDMLTVTAGLDWDDHGFYVGDPGNDTSDVEACDDWVPQAIEQPVSSKAGDPACAPRYGVPAQVIRDAA